MAEPLDRPWTTRWDGALGNAESLRRDRDLLENGGPAARAALLDDRSVSMGVAFRPPPDWEQAITGEGVAVLRRSSGGSGLLHEPGDLAWSLVLPRGSRAVGRDFARSFDRLGAPIVAALRAVGVRAEWREPLCASDRFCLFGRRGMALSVEGRILGGAAQHLTRRALLHHGVVGVSLHRPQLAEWFGVEPDLLRDRLTALGELVPSPDPVAVGRAFLRAAPSSFER